MSGVRESVSDVYTEVSKCSGQVELASNDELGDASYFELLLPELIAYFNKLLEAYQAQEG